jgi:hypothetical protein
VVQGYPQQVNFFWRGGGEREERKGNSSFSLAGGGREVIIE